MARILVVDDEEMLLKATARMLKFAGYEVVTEGHPVDALTRFVKGDKFDLIISDVVMPVMQGDELCKKIQGICPTPLILVSANFEVHHKAIECGAKYSFMKPYDNMDMLGAIKRLLK